jgi:hypothetical protein
MGKFDRIQWPCDKCFYNGGFYCLNDAFSQNFEKVPKCKGYERNDDNPGAFSPKDLGIGQDEPDY